jgi:hypothetical protein
MRVIVRVAYLDGMSEQRIMISGLFRFLDISRRDLATRATLRYGISHELQSILEQSQRWGRVKAEVYWAMRSKYAMALYALLELRRNLDRCIEAFTIEQFRELMSIKPDAYRVGFDFERSVVEPAVLEVNGRSDMSVRIDLQRKHSRAPFHAATMAWWRKSPEELVMVTRERNRSKVGRMARLKGAAAIVSPGTSLSLPGGGGPAT